MFKNFVKRLMLKAVFTKDERKFILGACKYSEITYTRRKQVSQAENALAMNDKLRLLL